MLREQVEEGGGFVSAWRPVWPSIVGMRIRECTHEDLTNSCDFAHEVCEQ